MDFAKPKLAFLGAHPNSVSRNMRAIHCEFTRDDDENDIDDDDDGGKEPNT